MGEVQPTVMCSVPRLYEKMYARVNEKVAGDPPLRQKIFRWAIGVGRESFGHRVNKTQPGALLKLKVAVADKLVFSKIKARTGGVSASSSPVELPWPGRSRSSSGPRAS